MTTWKDRYIDDYDPTQEQLDREIQTGGGNPFDFHDDTDSSGTTITPIAGEPVELNPHTTLWNEETTTLQVDNFVNVRMNRDFLENMLRQLGQHTDIICAGVLQNGEIDLTVR